MEPDSVGAKFTTKMFFPVGKTEFKFKLNNRIWSVSEMYKTLEDGMGGINNVIDVKPMVKHKSLKSKIVKVHNFQDSEKTIKFTVDLFELLDSSELMSVLGGDLLRFCHLFSFFI